MSLDNKLDQRQTPFAFPLQGRSYGSRSSSASFTYFHYVKQNFGAPTNTNAKTYGRDEFMQVEQGFVEDEIANVKISKSIAQASGTFSISLLPSKNWKQVISAGDWLIIYFQDDFKNKERYKSKPNNKNMMMLCNVDRVARSLQKNQNDDKNILRYVISGRGFGKVFEDTDIWYNPYTTPAANDILNKVTMVNAGLEIVGSPSTMVENLIDVFLGNGAILPGGKVEGVKNWAIPTALARVFGSSGDLNDVDANNAKFFDIITKRIQLNLPGYKVRQMITLNSNGSLHEMLKRSSNQLVNELYYEETRTNNGKIEISVFLKPRPTNTIFLSAHLGIEGRSITNIGTTSSPDRSAETTTNDVESMSGQIMSVLHNTGTTSSPDRNAEITPPQNAVTLQEWSDTNYVQISNAEILYEDMGKDGHSRMNLFWLKSANSIEQSIMYNANLGEGSGLSNPTFISPSIERCGLKRFESVLEFCYPTKEGGKGSSPDIILWKAFMLQLYDMHYANHLYDAGTIECTGVLEAELGKALRILPSNPAIKTEKVYLIEGYEHNWTFPGKWTTTFTLTHGQFKVKDGSDKIFIDVDSDDFGAPDTDIDTVYLAKTESSR